MLSESFPGIVQIFLASVPSPLLLSSQWSLLPPETLLPFPVVQTDSAVGVTNYSCVATRSPSMLAQAVLQSHQYMQESQKLDVAPSSPRDAAERREAEQGLKLSSLCCGSPLMMENGAYSVVREPGWARGQALMMGIELLGLLHALEMRME